MTSKNRLLGIQVLRGVAALMVALYHLSTQFAVNTGHVLFANIFRHGYLGVDLFFIISGFIIFVVHSKDIGQPHKFFTYIKKRIFRVMPGYWTLVLAKLVITGGVALSAQQLVQTFFLIPLPKPLFINVSWTLSFEFLFYITFAMLIVGRQFFFAFVALLLIISLGVLYCEPPNLWPYAFVTFFKTHHLMLFLFGTIAGRVYLTDAAMNPVSVPKARLVTLTCALIMFIFLVVATWLSNIEANALRLNANDTAVTSFSNASSYSVIFYSIPAAFIIYYTSFIEFRESGILFRSLLFLGKISYSFYLVHSYIIHYSFKVPMFGQLAVHYPILMLIPIVVAVIVAFGLFRLVEQPAMNFANKNFVVRQ